MVIEKWDVIHRPPNPAIPSDGSAVYPATTPSGVKDRETIKLLGRRTVGLGDGRLPQLLLGESFSPDAPPPTEHGTRCPSSRHGLQDGPPRVVLGNVSSHDGFQPTRDWKPAGVTPPVKAGRSRGVGR